MIENQPIAPIDFTVADDFTAPGALLLTVSSSNQALVTDAGLTLTGTGTTRTLTIALVAAATGTSTITVTASDGVLSSQRSFVLTVTPLLRYVLSEGATGAFFDTDILIANPHETPTPVIITFSTQDGAVITQNRTLLPMSQTRIKLDEIAGLEATSVSTMVTSLPGAPIVVERTMRWDATGYGAHAEKASPGAATEWYFAEGSQGFFSTFLLLANPHTAANIAHVTWLREGLAPIQRDYPMGPSSRVTVHAGDDAELVGMSFGAHVVFDQPGVAERAMYFGDESVLARRTRIRRHLDAVDDVVPGGGRDGLVFHDLRAAGESECAADGSDDAVSAGRWHAGDEAPIRLPRSSG